MARATILFVDDEEGVRTALARSLRHCDYRLLTAASAEEALEVLKREEVDIVVSDQVMPKTTGLEFLKIVHDRYPDAVRMILTGYADMSTAIAAINEGEIYRFLTKPWHDVELQVALHLACEKLELERHNRTLLAALRCQGVYDEPEVRRERRGPVVVIGPGGATPR